MKTLALRVVLAGILVATVAYKVQHAGAEPPDIRASVMHLLARQGWPAQEVAGSAPEIIGNVVTFRAAGCNLDGQIYVVDLGFQAAPILDQSIAADYTRHIAYLGRTWERQDRVSLRLEWLKQKVLSAFGIGHYAVNNVALVIAEPPGCHAADKIDWSAAWRPSDGRI